MGRGRGGLQWGGAPDVILYWGVTLWFFSAVGSVLISAGDTLCLLEADELARSLGVLVSLGCGYYSDGDSRCTVGRGMLDPGSFGWCLHGLVVGS